MPGLDFSGPSNTRASIFYEFVNKPRKSEVFIYSDGSKIPDGKLGAGYIILKINVKLYVGAHSVGRNNEVQDAEA